MNHRFAIPIARLSWLLLLLPGCGEQGTADPVASGDGGATTQVGEVRYLAMGDSISQGIGTPNFEAEAFPARLAERWRAQGCKVELKNVGIAGYTAADLVANEVPEITPFKPTFITVQDVNHAGMKKQRPSQHRGMTRLSAAQPAGYPLRSVIDRLPPLKR